MTDYYVRNTDLFVGKLELEREHHHYVHYTMFHASLGSSDLYFSVLHVGSMLVDRHTFSLVTWRC